MTPLYICDLRSINLDIYQLPEHVVIHHFEMVHRKNSWPNHHSSKGWCFQPFKSSPKFSLWTFPKHLWVATYHECSYAGKAGHFHMFHPACRWKSLQSRGLRRMKLLGSNLAISPARCGCWKAYRLTSQVWVWIVDEFLLPWFHIFPPATEIHFLFRGFFQVDDWKCHTSHDPIWWHGFDPSSSACVDCWFCRVESWCEKDLL